MNLYPPQAADLPNDESQTRHMLSSVARLRILRHILHHPASSNPDLTAATGYSQTAVRTALMELENAGFVSRTGASHGEDGRAPGRYIANREVIERAMNTLTAWLLH